MVEEPELNLLVSACMQHWLRLAIGEPEKARLSPCFQIRRKYEALG